MDLDIRPTRPDLGLLHYVRTSSLFDAKFYLAQVKSGDAEADPALHYLTTGEAAGAAASAVFNAADYVLLNPDLGVTDMNRLAHYEAHGRAEGRRCAFESDQLQLDDLRIDTGKPTVLLILHEATYTGAPVLGWNLARELKLTRNVVVVLRRGGPLVPLLSTAATALVGPPSLEMSDNPAELVRLAARLKSRYQPRYAIANSAETRLFGAALRGQGVPLISLIHEFATNAPPFALSEFYKASDVIVFPAEVVRRSSLDSYDYGLIAQRRTVILPQGPSIIPRQNPASTPAADNTSTSAQELARVFSEPDPPFTIVGIGAVDIRKGVDLFIAAATSLKARQPELKFRVIWVGGRPHPNPHTYYSFLDEQIARAGLEGRIVLAGEVDDLEPVYAGADAYFLSSRLDPLPNVGIDAALRGIPLICFEDATGFAELLKQDPRTSWLVAPYMDTGAVAEILATLAQDGRKREAAGAAVKAMASQRFSMIRYVAKLDELGDAAAKRREKRQQQVDTLLPEDAFDCALYFSSERTSGMSREAAIRRYLNDTLNVEFTGPAVWGHHLRRPLAGFHSLIYARSALGNDVEMGVDPLVDFIAKGRPAGPWSHGVIRLEEGAQRRHAPGSRLRAAIHGHFHYVDNFADFLTALEINQTRPDLLLTTTTQGHADFMKKMCLERDVRGRVEVEVGPNIGRDIGPFLSLLERRLQDYDVVGHLHGKRSVHTLGFDPELGNRWRNFLWQHLLGPAAAVADIVVERFAREPDLGLVFPENDFLIGWESNRAPAEALAPRLALPALPEHINFPVGTMFWARPAALTRLVNAKFTDADYGREPLPIDGTMLHALERLLPLVVQAEGYRYMTTYFPQVTR